MYQLTIDSAPAKLALNFEEVKKRLAAELSKYDGVVVTQETLADAKKLATELNQTAKAIDDRRKEEVAAVSEPIKQFDAQMRELVEMCKDGRAQLLDQVKVFEDEVREQVHTLLTEYLNGQWDDQEVEQEFRRATIDDLAILSNITKTGNLTARAGNEVIARVQADRALQDRTHMRIAQLESTSYQAGLAAPLTRDHVAGILFADDEAYQAEVERIVSAEVERQKVAQEKLQERLIKENRMAPPAGYKKPQVSKGEVAVVATFNIEVSDKVTDEQIKAALQKKMEVAGFTTLQSIEIIRAQEAA